MESGEALAGRGLIANTLCFLSAMLDERGWRDSAHQGAFQLPEGINWNDLARLKNHELGELRETLLGFAWRLLQIAIGRFSFRLLVAPGERDNEAQYTDAETICDVLGFDLTQLRAQAAETIPYAKCWLEEVEDAWIAPVIVTHQE